MTSAKTKNGTMKRAMASTTVLLAHVVAGCAIEGELGGSEQGILNDKTGGDELRSTPKCKGSGCGGNGVLIADSSQPIAFHELHAHGWPNAEGVSLRAFLAPPDDKGARAPLGLRVERDELVGYTKTRELRGRDLVGARLILDWGASPVIASYVLQIEELGASDDTAKFWIDPDRDVPRYRIVWRDASAPEGSTLAPLCEDSGPQSFALFLQGERYDIDRLTVRDEPWREPHLTWFNISCVGNVVAKMHFLRHTVAGSDATHWRTENERTAMLKMLNADYCGFGLRFTENGVPLRYVTSDGWHIDHYAVPYMPLAPKDAKLHSIDAVWSHRGAECIDIPRLVHRDRRDRWMFFAEMVGQHDPDGACWPSIYDIPLCSERSPAWQGYGYLLAANPHATN